MPNCVEIIEGHLAYTSWASSRIVAAAKELGSDELTRDFGTAHRSVLETLVHVFAADRVWFGRLSGNPPARFVDPERDMHFRVLEEEWPEILKKWREWAAELSEEAALTPLTYKDLKGNQHQTPLWQIVLHLVNHATHHRGQVMGFLRTLGHTPPPLDLIAYYRSL